MKLKTLMLVAFMLLGQNAYADKVAVLGIQEALLTSNAANSFRENLQRELKSDEDRVVELEKQAQKIRKKIQEQGASLSQDELQQLQLQFQKAFEEYQKTGRALQQKRAEKEQAFVEKMRPKMDEIIRSLIETNQYDVIVAKQATLYAKKGFDITPKVVQLLNEQ